VPDVPYSTSLMWSAVVSVSWPYKTMTVLTLKQSFLVALSALFYTGTSTVTRIISAGLEMTVLAFMIWCIHSAWSDKGLSVLHEAKKMLKLGHRMALKDFACPQRQESEVGPRCPDTPSLPRSWFPLWKDEKE
jgi:hypothetical protein